MKKILLLSAAFSFLWSCSGQKLKEREHENIKRSYQVRDASGNKRPGWIEDPAQWAKEKKLDIKTYRYFAYETTPAVNRDIACQLAKAKVKSEIAGEISSFIDDSLSNYQEGTSTIDENNPDFQAMKQYVETSLVSKTASKIHGVQVRKKYWERRQYQEDLGAAKNYAAYTCAVLVRIDSKGLKSLVQRASKEVVKQAKGEVKAKAQKALENAEVKFLNL